MVNTTATATLASTPNHAEIERLERCADYAIWSERQLPGGDAYDEATYTAWRSRWSASDVAAAHRLALTEAITANAPFSVLEAR